MATEFGTGKTVFILAIVVGCFAVLWPKIFYPMLQGSVEPKPTVVNTNECCDVIFEKDVSLIKIMTELCEKILRHQEDFDKRLVMNFQQGKLTKEIVYRCKQEVMTKCDIDITTFLEEKVRLGQSYKQILDDIRSLNSSLCLKENFGVTPNSLGAPRYLKIWTLTTAKHLRQERPPHLRPEMLHPALREKGRAIPQSHIVPKVVEKEGRPPPVPGMRPPMGGAGHVVPAPKGGSTMGIIMPMYTIGIVIFFMYTMMKLLFKKSDESTAYKEFKPDPEFRRVVFNESDYYNNRTSHHPHKVEEESATKLVVTAISGLVAEVQRDILSKQLVTDSLNKAEESESDVFEKEISSPEEAIKLAKQVDSAKSEVRVLGMELTESVEGGKRWSRPSSPNPPSSPTPTLPVPVPQEIFLEGSLPSQSHLLVSQSQVEKVSVPKEETDIDDDDLKDASVILSGKVTLSLIGVDSESDLKEDEISRKKRSIDEFNAEDIKSDVEENVIEQVGDVPISQRGIDDFKGDNLSGDELIKGKEVQEIIQMEAKRLEDILVQLPSRKSSIVEELDIGKEINLKQTELEEKLLGKVEAELDSLMRDSFTKNDEEIVIEDNEKETRGFEEEDAKDETFEKVDLNETKTEEIDGMDIVSHGIDSNVELYKTDEEINSNVEPESSVVSAFSVDYGQEISDIGELKQEKKEVINNAEGTEIMNEEQETEIKDEVEIMNEEQGTKIKDEVDEELQIETQSQSISDVASSDLLNEQSNEASELSHDESFTSNENREKNVSGSLRLNEEDLDGERDNNKTEDYFEGSVIRTDEFDLINDKRDDDNLGGEKKAENDTEETIEEIKVEMEKDFSGVNLVDNLEVNDHLQLGNDDTNVEKVENLSKSLTASDEEENIESSVDVNEKLETMEIPLILSENIVEEGGKDLNEEEKHIEYSPKDIEIDRDILESNYDIETTEPEQVSSVNFASEADSLDSTLFKDSPSIENDEGKKQTLNDEFNFDGEDAIESSKDSLLDEFERFSPTRSHGTSDDVVAKVGINDSGEEEDEEEKEEEDEDDEEEEDYEKDGVDKAAGSANDLELEDEEKKLEADEEEEDEEIESDEEVAVERKQNSVRQLVDVVNDDDEAEEEEEEEEEDEEEEEEDEDDDANVTNPTGVNSGSKYQHLNGVEKLDDDDDEDDEEEEEDDDDDEDNDEEERNDRRFSGRHH